MESVKRSSLYRKTERLLTPLEGNEAHDGALNRLASREDAVVLENEAGLVAAERVGNVVALVVAQHDAAKVFVEAHEAVEGARVLRRVLDVASEGAEGLRAGKTASEKRERER